MRRLSFPATLLCAGLTLAAIGLWIQSHVAPRMTYFWNVDRIAFSSSEGEVYLTYLRPPAPGTLKGGGVSGSTVTLIVGRTGLASLDAVEYYPNAKTVRRGWILDLSYPTLLTLTLALTGFAFLLDRHRLKSTRRRQAGLCPACGYDLRATPTQCPECGSPA